MSASELPRTFDAAAAEQRYYAWWEESGFFTPSPDDPGEPYCIVIPPPNVTGSLHMGHAMDNTLQDILIRYKRMDGFNTVWIPGTDHAGIATEMMVTRKLKAQGVERLALGREAFLEKVWEWKAEYGNTITTQLRRLGVSCDWSRERFTMDEGLSRAVRQVFVNLYEQGLIYKGERLINWDPAGRTVLSDLEVEYDEAHQSELWSFAYPLSDGSGEIVVATTRPETMLGDTAIAVNPADERYQHLIGKTVRHPILDREIPIIGDSILVDMAFGTGAVKVTPAHDPNDYEVGLRHDLPFITLFDETATVNAAGGPYAGQDRFEARENIKSRLAELGLDRGTEAHTMRIGRSQRTGAIVEPMISKQWFVRMKPLAGPALAAVENGSTNFVPKQWENTYFTWMRNIRDWCISRQLWWGHRIPAWECADCGEQTVAIQDPTACAHCEGVKLIQDPDALDTWFSSALWPFSVFGWPDKTPELDTWYPGAVLVTGFDIIFFWVARMIFSGVHHMGAPPFKDVCIHGLLRDEHGQKMSKTKGNVIDPLEAIDEHGCDAFRFTLAQATVQGRDPHWNPRLPDASARFVNKIWQAFRFASLNLEDYDAAAVAEPSVYDRWILVRTGAAAARVRDALDTYRFNDAATEIHAFIWGEFCDWYLELSKPAMKAGGPARAAAQQTLVTVLAAIARLIHPVMPFLSEELWQRLPDAVKSGVETVMLAPYPHADDFPQDDAILSEVAFVQQAIVGLRKLKNDMELSPRVELALQVRGERTDTLAAHLGGLSHMARVVSITPSDERPLASATVPVPGAEIFVPLAGLVDLDAERSRLDAELQKVDKDIRDLTKRLGNPGFVDRAPPDVVQRFRDKLVAAQARREQLAAAREALS